LYDNFSSLLNRVEFELGIDSRIPLVFDIIGYSMGGLVARAATEAAFVRGFGSRVAHLVTIATPHTGALSAARICDHIGPGIADMVPGSAFLQRLNSNRPSESTVYYTLAGTGDGDLLKLGTLLCATCDCTCDGIVPWASAHARGTRLAPWGQATLPLFHTPELGRPAMPNHEDVYGHIRRWLFATSFKPRCENLAGTWELIEASERGSCETPIGVVEDERKCGSRNECNDRITIQQEGCEAKIDLKFSELDPEDKTVFTYEGRINGPIVNLEGPWTDFEGPDAEPFTRNEVKLSGCGCEEKLVFSTTGVYEGRLFGSPVKCKAKGKLVFQRPTPQGPHVSLRGIVNSASYLSGSAAPESGVSIFGNELAGTTAAADSAPLPASLAGTSVEISDNAGVTRPSPLFFVSPRQINCLVPSGTAPGRARLTVRVGGLSTSADLEIASVAPGLFAADASGHGVAAGQVVRSANGTVTTGPIFDRNTLSPVPIDLGGDGDQVFLVLFGTGLRSNLGSVIATVGGVGVPVVYAGRQPEFVGLDQVNLGPLPASLRGRGEADVILKVDGVTTNIVTAVIR
jgi:uncharacterized protein (TIGR03437 family)